MSNSFRQFIYFNNSINLKQYLLTDFQRKVLNEVKQNGFYITNLEEICSNKSSYQDLLQLSIKIKENLIERLSNKDKSLFKRGKTFVARYVDTHTKFMDLKPAVDLIIDEFFYNISAHYLNTTPKVTNIDFWYNIPNSDPKKIGSQNWHKDYEDKSLLKVFVYLEDVSHYNGPFSFVKGSHEYNSNTIPKELLRNFPDGIVVNEDTILKYFSKNNLIELIGKKNTVLIVDTSGLHKGGFIEKGYRFMFTFTYTTFAGISSRNFNFKKISLTGYNPKIAKSIIFVSVITIVYSWIQVSGIDPAPWSEGGWVMAFFSKSRMLVNLPAMRSLADSDASIRTITPALNCCLCQC